MNRLILLFILFFASLTNVAQKHSSASIFAHNDYEKPIPFHTAYNAQVDFIEVDVILQGYELQVAHSASEIQLGKTLELLYLNPLNDLIEKNGGTAYPDKEKSLTLMIDLKTEAVATLNVLVFKLKKYPRLIACKTLVITVSGNMPSPALWKNFPNFIHFDGRAYITYTAEQLKRIHLVSANFQSYSKWTGKDKLNDADRKKIITVIESVHTMGKPFRFWAIPDFENGWRTMLELGVDIINTDDVAGASAFLK
ncbi:MAG: phosphatidylinositol-specific phospholipase C/glycerophosphodiester phosphodiesterase family protein [Cyclobacteriaceae bacterium]|nr:phosphatidylinositol-specific phospholipase C/glycerophosphodiester phosphodiesterase family protein [Cyclobacteriaceae bacterium]